MHCVKIKTKTILPEWMKSRRGEAIACRAGRLPPQSASRERTEESPPHCPYRFLGRRRGKRQRRQAATRQRQHTKPAKEATKGVLYTHTNNMCSLGVCVCVYTHQRIRKCTQSAQRVAIAIRHQYPNNHRRFFSRSPTHTPKYLALLRFQLPCADWWAKNTTQGG